MQLDLDFPNELAAIYRASGVLSIARKRLADAQKAKDVQAQEYHSAAIVGAEALLAKAYEQLGRALFDNYQRLTGEFAQVEGPDD